MNDNMIVLEKHFENFFEIIKQKKVKIDLAFQKYSKEKRDVVSKYGELIELSVDESKQKLNEIIEELNNSYMKLMSTNLDYSLKLKYEEELFKDLEEAIKLYEDYATLSKEEKISILDQKYNEVEQKIANEQKRLEEEMLLEFKIKIRYLSRLLSMGFDDEVIISAYLKLEEFSFEDERLDFAKKVIIDTELNNYSNLNKLIEKYRKDEIEKNKHEQIYKQIDSLMDKFYTNKDYTLLGEVSKLTSLLPESEKRTFIVNLIKEESMKLIMEKLNLELDEVEKRKDLIALDSVVKRIKDLGLTFDENNSLIKRIKNIREKLTNIASSNIDNNYSDKFNKINLMLHEYVYLHKLPALAEAKKLIDNMADGKEKDILLESYNDIKKAYKTEIIKDILDEAEKEKNLEKLNLACKSIKGIRDLEQRDDLMTRAAEVDAAIKNVNMDDDIDKDKPKKKGKKTSLTWKTALATAVGVGIGSAVFFTAGAVGVSIVVIAGGVANKIISIKRKQLAAQRKLNGPIKVKSVSEPTPGLKGKFEKFKKYLKSEEGLRDITWMINSVMITTGVLQVASLINNVVSNTINGGSGIEPNPQLEPTGPQTSIEPVPTQPDVGNMKIGDSLGSNVPEVGYDSIDLANSGMNSEHLISEYVNSDSIIKGVGIQNADGTITRISANGMTLNEIASKFGVTTDDLVMDIASKDGTSLAWTKLADMVKNVGGKIR